MRYTFLILPLFLVSIILWILLGCSTGNGSRTKNRHIYLLGSDTIILFLDSTFHEVGCGIYQHDDTGCQGYESNKCSIYCNYYHMPLSLSHTLNTASPSRLNTEEEFSMVEKIRSNNPESIIETPRYVKSVHEFEGISITFQQSGKKHLRFRGYSQKQNLLLSVYIDSKSSELNLEEVLFTFLDNLYKYPADIQSHE